MDTMQDSESVKRYVGRKYNEGKIVAEEPSSYICSVNRFARLLSTWESSKYEVETQGDDKDEQSIEKQHSPSKLGSSAFPVDNTKREQVRVNKKQCNKKYPN